MLDPCNVNDQSNKSLQSSILYCLDILKYVLEKGTEDASNLIGLITTKFKLGDHPSYVHNLAMIVKNSLTPKATEVSMQIFELLNNDAYAHKLLVSAFEGDAMLGDITQERVNRIIETNPTIVQQSHENNDALDQLAHHFTRYGTSYAEIESIAKLMIGMPGQITPVPQTKWLFIQEFSRRIAIECTRHIYCSRCKEFVKSTQHAEKLRCATCAYLQQFPATSVANARAKLGCNLHIFPIIFRQFIDQRRL